MNLLRSGDAGSQKLFHGWARSLGSILLGALVICLVTPRLVCFEVKMREDGFCGECDIPRVEEFNRWKCDSEMI